MVALVDNLDHSLVPNMGTVLTKAYEVIFGKIFAGAIFDQNLQESIYGQQ